VAQPSSKKFSPANHARIASRWNRFRNQSKDWAGCDGSYTVAIASRSRFGRIIEAHGTQAAGLVLDREANTR
jgi:hypothetical protein